jgi:PTH1 family peptidyl-tRNA hydrolase
VIRCVIGLGNPGRKYEGTRHNIGFRVLDVLAARAQARWRHRCLAPYDMAALDAPRGLLLCKPRTYMNHSGRAVAALRRSKRIPPEELLVVYDDVHLGLGRMRARTEGSAGGHNGMKSIIAVLGTQAFPRLRVGIGHGDGDERIRHVLGRFSADERACVEEVVAAAADAVVRLVEDEWLTVVQDVNAWTATTACGRT